MEYSEPKNKSNNYYVRKVHNTKLIKDTYPWLVNIHGWNGREGFTASIQKVDTNHNVVVF